MLRRGIFVGLFLVFADMGTVQAQAPFDSYQAFRDSLVALTAISDVAARDAGIAQLWDSLGAYGQRPYRAGTSVAFLYRGSALSIGVAGDFNSWNPAAAQRLGDSDVWLREETFPGDARLDYKVVRNGDQWILDPANPLIQRSGFGDNSELRMPDYEASPWVERRAGVPPGSFSPARSMRSAALGYTVTYRVYTPSDYHARQLSNLPVLYVTDGHEYADELMGSTRVVLDNMIYEGRIPPVMAVFIDPRVAGNNRRAEQYIENPRFADFVADELVPEIDTNFRTDPRRVSRGIIGTSLGGLNSVFFAAHKTETFYLIGVQSPAFQAGRDIFALFEDEPVRNVRIHMSWGTINDVAPVAQRMEAILTAKGYTFETDVRNEGHSWGLWRALLDDVFEYFWGADSNVSTEPLEVPSVVTLGPSFPNPTGWTATIPFSISRPGYVSVTVHDATGRQVATLADSLFAEGSHEVTWNAVGMPPGTYFYSLRAPDRPLETRSLVLLR